MKVAKIASGIALVFGTTRLPRSRVRYDDDPAQIGT
ncbi:hypothetical protein ABIF62_006840 [Bradyrhizobium japonicum]